jgi:hypothetical protein
MSDLVLSAQQIFELTGYKLPALQLEVLHRRGFYRACIGRNGVVLTKAHYESVEHGVDKAVPPPRKVANLSHLRPA